MRLAILGGGLSGLALASFLRDAGFDEIVILEKEDRLGGLCRSFIAGGVAYDIGPHIIFSKDREILSFINDTVLAGDVNRLRRSNRIVHKGTLVQYPFENDLSKLPKEDIEWCVNTFVHNPYEDYPISTMLQFFLKTFGEGITNLYLRPYNEKIWKFDPAFMDVQMVERIPKPPKEDILRSAAGETVDGYLHQLYFTYPRSSGIESIIKGVEKRLGDNVRVVTGAQVTRVVGRTGRYEIEAGGGRYEADRVVSTIPVNRLCAVLDGCPDEVGRAAKDMRYNSIIITIVHSDIDLAGDNFAFMIADKGIIFHRLSKIDFLGSDYSSGHGANYMVEITYRKGDVVDGMTDEDVGRRLLQDLVQTGFVQSRDEAKILDMRRFEYAYVVYDLNHRVRMNLIRNYVEREAGITLCGRFGEFEYLNMDAVFKNAMQKAELVKGAM